jgi:two-component system sensor histidine kinase CpxA
MRSLFAKILGWFVLTLVITLAATILTTALTYNPYSAPRPTAFSALLSLETAEAEDAWETGGAIMLHDTLRRFTAITHAQELIFTDTNGTDVMTGETHPDLMQNARSKPRFPFSGRGGPTFVRFSTDGRYVLFVVIPPQSLLFSALQPVHLWVLGLSVLLCYALAYNLTSPLRRLQVAVDRFGRGDLDARAEEGRRDELGELAGTFNRMADRLQTLLAAERRLLLDVSHELRSPLARLSVAVELARGEGSALPLDRIQKESDRLNELITQMLEVTRIEGDPGARKHARIRLDELIGGLVEDCSIEADARGCSLEMAGGPSVSVDGDGELLRRAIENVMRNAIRHAPRATKVEVSLQNGGGRAKVRVRDYGPGVPEAALPHLFDPFYRVDSDRNRGSGGVGLGLSIAKRAVELHQGSLQASNASPGLLVEIELPA